MAKQLTSYTNRFGDVITAAYARVISPAILRTQVVNGQTVTTASVSFSIYSSKSAREGGADAYETRTVTVEDSDPLFASVFGSAPTGETTFADFYAKSYALLTQHPDTSALFTGATNV